MMKTELHDVVSKAGEDWDKYRTKVEDFLVDWERHNTALLRYPPPTTMCPRSHTHTQPPSRWLIGGGWQSVGSGPDGGDGAAEERDDREEGHETDRHLRGRLQAAADQASADPPPQPPRTHLRPIHPMTGFERHFHFYFQEDEDDEARGQRTTDGRSISRGWCCSA